jgi:adenosylmethionine-8-amino-7-oxononanoate aminotransferase
MPKYIINSVAVCPDRLTEYPRLAYGDGVYLYDDDGKKYLDGVAGKAAVANIGHGNKVLAQAVAEQLGRIAILPTYCFEPPLLDDYLKKLTDYSPAGLNKAWLVTSGSEAIENACKLAFQYHCIRGQPERCKFIGKEHSYHGNSIFGLDVGGIKYRKEFYKALFKGHHQIPSSHCFRCPFKLERTSCELECAKSLEEYILKEGPETIAAFIVEPVVGAALGAAVAPDGYLREIRKICDRFGIVMIADEVMTGFGRTGYNFAVNHWNVVPDIIATGKGMGSGYFPLAAIIAHDRIMAPFEEKNVPFGSLYSYACSSIGALVGNYVIDFLIGNDINLKVQTVGKRLLSLLTELLKYPIIGDVRGLGLMLSIEFVSDSMTKAPFPPESRISELFANIAMQNGLIVYPCKGTFDGFSGDHILLTPPLILTEAQAEEMYSILDRSIRQLLEHLR